MKSRDTRAAFNRKQGILNYNKFFKKPVEKADEEVEENVIDIVTGGELNKMNQIIFDGKPKRVYRTNRNLEAVALQDPKRVHQALREFNDISANSVFQQMLEQIAQIEKDQAASGSLGFISSAPGGANENEDPSEVIKNVEKMLM